MNLLISATEARINRYLKNNAIKIPEALENTLFKVILPPLPFVNVNNEFYCHLLTSRVVLNQQAHAADVTIELSRQAFVDLARGEKLAALLIDKKIHMHGDIGKAQALQHWLESIALSKEDAFAEVFGDDIAFILAEIEKQAAPLVTSALAFGKSLLDTATEKMGNASQPAEDSEALKQQILRLREQNDRLEARLNAIADKLDKQHNA